MLQKRYGKNIHYIQIKDLQPRMSKNVNKLGSIKVILYYWSIWTLSKNNLQHKDLDIHMHKYTREFLYVCEVISCILIIGQKSGSSPEVCHQEGCTKECLPRSQENICMWTVL